MATSLASLHEADDLNTCAVCYDKYNQSDRIPKYLLCLHTFCINCLGKMMLDSFTTAISCPTCRTVTSLGRASGLVSLRTNEHALRVLELEEKIVNISSTNTRTSAWCHTCDELASSTCTAYAHSLTQLSSKNEMLLSQNQMNKIRLNLSYALGRRMEVDSYLKSIKQSISILDKHVGQLKEDNSLQIDLIEGILQDLDTSMCQSSEQRSRVNLESEAETAYSTALLLAQTFEDAKNILISMSIETTSGRTALVLPWLNKIKLCLMNQIDDKAINAAGLNTLSFILLLQLQNQQIHNQLIQNRTAAVAVPPSIQTSMSLRSIFPNLQPQFCFVDVELYGERARLLFQVAAHVSHEMSSSFIRGFQSGQQHNYCQSTVVKAGISLFVVLGSSYSNRSAAAQSEDVYNQRLWIANRGDVGLYCNCSLNGGVSDFVILLAPFSDRNVRRAPLVAHLIDGFNFCLYLSHLKLNERNDARVVNCGVI